MIQLEAERTTRRSQEEEEFGYLELEVAESRVRT